MGDDFNVDMQTYYDYTMEFLTRCDAVVVCKKSENSKGTQEEIKRAKELGIPVYNSVKEFDAWMKVELHELIGEEQNND